MLPHTRSLGKLDLIPVDNDVMHLQWFVDSEFECFWRVHRYPVLLRASRISSRLFYAQAGVQESRQLSVGRLTRCARAMQAVQQERLGCNKEARKYFSWYFC